MKASETCPHHCLSNTQSGPTSWPSRAIVPPRRRGAPAGLCRPRAPAAPGARAAAQRGSGPKRHRPGPAQPRFPAASAAERVTMTIGNACRLDGLPPAAGQFSDRVTFRWFLPMWEILLPLGANQCSKNSTSTRRAPWRSLGGRGEPGLLPRLRQLQPAKGEYQFLCPLTSCSAACPSKRH